MHGTLLTRKQGSIRYATRSYGFTVRYSPYSQLHANCSSQVDDVLFYIFIYGNGVQTHGWVPRQSETLRVPSKSQRRLWLSD